MIITDTTLVGYTVINGTWRLQLALMAGAIYDYYLYESGNVVQPNIAIKYPNIDVQLL